MVKLRGLKLNGLLEQFINLGIPSDSEIEHLLHLPIRHASSELQKVRLGPTEGPIFSAIRSRQHNKRTEYLRAFDNLLNEYQITSRPPSFVRAIAIVTNVVINDPDIDVTYDDVRKALACRR